MSLCQKFSQFHETGHFTSHLQFLVPMFVTIPSAVHQRFITSISDCYCARHMLKHELWIEIKLIAIIFCFFFKSRGINRSNDSHFSIETFEMEYSKCMLTPKTELINFSGYNIIQFSQFTDQFNFVSKILFDLVYFLSVSTGHYSVLLNY